MNRIIRDKFRGKDEMTKCIKEKAGSDDNGNLNVDDFKAWVVD